MTVPFIHPAFSAGEISPDLFGRVDLAKFSVGASTLKNFVVNYRGGAKSRAGTKFVGECFQSLQALSTLPPRLIPFQFNISQAYALEFGDHYMSVIANGGYVLNSDSSRFKLATPYAAADLPLLKYAQSADVMSLTHQSYPPMDLARLAANNWTLTTVAFAASIGPPQNVVATPTVHPGDRTTTPPLLSTTYQYVVTAIDAKTSDESVPSAIATASDSVNIAETAGSVVVTWDTVAGANQYNIYKAPPAYHSAAPAGALFSYAGTSFGGSFVDTNITADGSRTPPIHDNPFAPGAITNIVMTAFGSGYSNVVANINTTTGSGAAIRGIIVPNDPVAGGAGQLEAFIVDNGGSGYAPTDTITITGDGTGAAATLTIGPQTGTWPGVVAYFQQRRVYASTTQQPDTYFASQPGAFHNFDRTIPPVDSDAIEGTPWSQQVNGIQWMLQVPGGLMIGTGLGGWLLSGAGSTGGFGPQNALTPADEVAVPQAANGFNPQVQPIAINYHMLYVQQGGSIVRDLQYNFYANIYTGADVSALSTHLIIGYQITQWAWCEVPFKVVWAVRNDGVLLSLTYLAEQDVYGWAHHDTQGSVVSVCSVSEPPNNSLYLVVQRTVQGAARYYVERMDDRIWNAVYSSWCVDCGLHYQGPPVGTISGLDHLDGLTVTGLSDGRVIPPTVVSGGVITLPWHDAQNVVVGLPYTCQLQSVYLDTGQPTVQGRRKNIFAVTARVRNSAGVTTGTNQPDGSAIQGDGALYQTPAWSNMVPFLPPPGQPEQAFGFFTGDIRINTPADWRKPAQIAIEQLQPLPCEILALVPEVLEGDTVEAEIKPPQQGPGPHMLRAA
jgi:hypothetical protein